MKKFFETETYAMDRGYTIHISRAPEYATVAVIEDADGKRTLVDVSDIGYQDFEDFLDAVVEKYESNPSSEIIASDGTYTIGYIDGQPAEWDGNMTIPTEDTDIRMKPEGSTFGVNVSDEYEVRDGKWIDTTR